MSIQKIHLNKLLKLTFMSDKELISALRQDIREEIKKGSGGSEGGDFYQPFWFDVKQHVLGDGDLSVLTKERIRKHPGRTRLYTQLEQGFLTLWKRGDNQDVSLLPKNPRGRYTLADISLTIKVENLMAIDIDGQERIGYPYWFPEPPLSEAAARIGLFVMMRALSNEQPENMRIFDVMRANFFSLENCPLKGDEERELVCRYNYISTMWERLRDEYE
ncbi:MAG: hypothetical protein ACK4NR_03600 [Micavibrio sp.]